MQTETQRSPQLQTSQARQRNLKQISRSVNGLRYLMESIIVLVVVVMLVRVFALEGFLIQTGSMAPALRGYHQNLVCPTCEFAFAYGAEKKSEEKTLRKNENQVFVTCPHCGQQKIDASHVPITQGDQLLVHKFAYDFGYQPSRLDVILFRNPQKPSEVYVKRVLGLPGEVIHLFGGDLFVNGERFRKNLAQQYATRIPVFDTRHDLKRSRWQPAVPDNTNWQNSNSGFDFHSQNQQSEIDWLVYEHRLARGETEQIYDDYGYNDERPEKQRREIHDLMIALPLKVNRPAGQLVVQIRQQRKIYELQIHFEQRQYRIREVNSEEILGQNRLPEHWNFNTEHLLEFSLIDQQLLVALDQKLIDQPIALETGLPGLYEQTNQVSWPIRVGISGADCQIANLQLYRDIYYTQRVSGRLTKDPAMPENYQLSDKGYFVLGDNSPISADSREWKHPEVAEHLILGKPIFVHLPSQPRLLRIGQWSVRIRIPDWSRIRYID